MTKIEALRELLAITPETVIDDMWFSDAHYLTKDNLYTLQAIFTLSGCKNYDEVLKRYEGLTIEGFIKKILDL